MGAPVIGWRAWVADPVGPREDRRQYRVVSSRDIAWRDVPAHGIVYLIVFTESGGRHYLANNDYYWGPTTGLGSRTEWGCAAEHPERIDRDALKDGVYINTEVYNAITVEAMTSRWEADP